MAPDSEEEDLLTGTDITKEAFNKAVEVLRRLLGYEMPEAPQEPQGRRSRLSLNIVKKPPNPVMPVDEECLQRFQTLAEAKRWTAFQLKPCKTFRLEEEPWKEVFRTPYIPEEAAVKLRAAGALSQSGKTFSNLTTAKTDKALLETDRAARAGMRYASTLLLVAEILSKSFQQADSGGISRKDTGAIVTLLGPLSRLVFDQFARVAVKTTSERRTLVLDALAWPSASIKKSFESLPMLGEDMFGGKFGDHLQSEATKQKDSKGGGLQSSQSFFL